MVIGSQAQGHTDFLLVRFVDGLGKLQLHARFEVAGFVYYGNIGEYVLKRQIRF